MRKTQISLQEQHLDALEGLLAQSLQGFHHLFEHHLVAEILRTPTEEIDFFTFDNLPRVQTLLSEFIANETYLDKVSFLNELSQEDYETLVRAYFHLVDNSMLASSHELH